MIYFGYYFSSTEEFTGNVLLMIRTLPEMGWFRCGLVYLILHSYSPILWVGYLEAVDAAQLLLDVGDFPSLVYVCRGHKWTATRPASSSVANFQSCGDYCPPSYKYPFYLFLVRHLRRLWLLRRTPWVALPLFWSSTHLHYS